MKSIISGALSTRTKGNGYTLKQKIPLKCRKTHFSLKWLKTVKSFPESLWSLHSWRYKNMPEHGSIDSGSGMNWI